MPTAPCPLVRSDLEFFFAGSDEDPFVVVRDPLGYVQHVDRLTIGALVVLRCLDGEHTLEQVRDALDKDGKLTLPIEHLQQFVDQLDEGLLLEGERLERAKADRAAWLASPVREPAHADAAYPADRDAARQFLDGHLAHAAEPSAGQSTGPLQRLIAPHIDLQLGSEIHGHAHARMRAAGRPDVVVVIGVCHQQAAAPFIACRKDFATPFGTVRHDKGFLDALEGHYGAPLTEGEIAHDREHSVEFQALWLAHHWPDDAPTMVPLLARGFHEQIEAGESPRDDAGVERFIAALQRTLAEDDRRIVVIASVDLAHVGPIYDHAEGLDETGEEELAESDRALLDAMANNDAEAFFAAIAKDNNARHVCGVAPIYVTLRLGTGEGEVLRYGQGRIHPETGSVVSYAAVAFSD
jgi:AmmeMemoRadiSam system protein B